MSKKQLVEVVCFTFIVFTLLPLASFSGFGGLATIKGVVTDDAIDEPLEGVKVTLYYGSMIQDSDYTDSEGRYSVSMFTLSNVYVSLKFERTSFNAKTIGTTAKPGQTVVKNVAMTRKVYFVITDPESTYGSLDTNNLGTDWGRHPTDSLIYDKAYSILLASYGSDLPTINQWQATYTLWNYVKQHWTQVSGIPKTDLDIVASNNWQGPCYATANVLCGLLRSVGIPTRNILLKFKGGFEHVFCEAYVGSIAGNCQLNGWVTLDANFDQGGWLGWDALDDFVNGPGGSGWNWVSSIPTKDLEVVRWVYEETGDLVETYWYFNDESYPTKSGYWGISKYHHSQIDSEWVTWEYYQQIFDDNFN